MALTAAQLTVKVNADTKGALAGLAATDAAVAKSGGGLASFASSAAKVAPGAMIAAGAIAGIGVAVGVAVHAAGDFQQQLTRLVTDAGENADHLNMVRKGILQLATDTGTSTDQLTSGMYVIESAGYHGAAGLHVLKDAAEGAKVGQADLGTVANATSTLMTDFKNANLDSTTAVNALIATVSHGKTTLEDLSGALAMVAPTAAASSVKLNDMLGAMATMTGEGVPAADAATYLRQMLIAMQAPASAARGTLKEIGLTTQQVADAMHQSLPGALTLITDHLKQKFPEGSAAYVAALKNIAGGSRQMQGMLDLTGSHLSTFGENVKTITAQVAKGGKGITDWDTVQGNFNFQMGKAGAAVQVLAITVGSALLPPLTRLVGALAPLLANFASWVAALLQNKQAMQVIAPILGVLAGVIGGVMVAALVSMAAAAWAALAPFLVFAAPFILVGAAIAALVIGFKLLYDHVEGFRNLVNLLITVLKVSFQGAVQGAGVILGWLGDHVGFLGQIFAAFGQGIQIDIRAAGIILGWLGDRFGDIGRGIQIDIQAAGTALGWLGDRFTQIGDFIVGVWQSLTTAVKREINLIISLVNRMISFIDGVHINLPSVAGFGGGTIGFHIPLLPQLASGGLVASGGLALVGERGPEIVSLPGGASVLPNPQSRALAAGAGQGGEQTIIIQLDGRTIAQTTAKHMPSVLRLTTGVRGF